MPRVNRNEPVRADYSGSSYSLVGFMREFPDDATCLSWLWRNRFAEDGEHAECPKCEKVRKFHKVKERPAWDCDSCGHHLHPLAGTIFHKSSTSLQLWFFAIHLMTSTRCGLSAKQLERELGVTYKTAWRMFTLIRNKLMAENAKPLRGYVEIDETSVDCKPRKRQGQNTQIAVGAPRRSSQPVTKRVGLACLVVVLVALGATACGGGTPAGFHKATPAERQQLNEEEERADTVDIRKKLEGG
jgi:transposase-like protein